MRHVAVSIAVFATLILGQPPSHADEAGPVQEGSGEAYTIRCRVVGNSGKPFTAPNITVRDGQIAKVAADTLQHPVIVAVKGDGYEESAIVEPAVDGTTIMAKVLRVDDAHVLLDLSAELAQAKEEPGKVSPPGVACQAVEFNSVKRRRVENIELGKTAVMKLPDASRSPWCVEVTVVKAADNQSPPSAPKQATASRTVPAIAISSSQ